MSINLQNHNHPDTHALVQSEHTTGGQFMFPEIKMNSLTEADRLIVDPSALGSPSTRGALLIMSEKPLETSN